MRRVMPAPDGSERVDEVLVDRDEFRFRMTGAHQCPDHGALLAPRVDEDQVLAGLDVVVEFSEILVLRGYPGQAAFPRTEHRGHGDDDEIDGLHAITPRMLQLKHPRRPDSAPGFFDSSLSKAVYALILVS